MKRIKRFFDWEVRHPIVVVILIALITAFFGWFAYSGFRIENPTSHYLQKDLPSKMFYDRFIELFGNDEIILIVVKNEDGVYSPEFLKALSVMEDKLRLINKSILGDDYGKTPNPITKIVGITTIKHQYDRAKEGFTARMKKSRLFKSMKFPPFEKSARMTKLFTKNIVSEDAKATAITLILRSHQDKVVKNIQQIIDRAGKKNGWKIYQIGTSVISNALVTKISGDLKRLSGLTMFVVLAVLTVCFRRIKGVLLPGLTCGTAFVWTIGFMGLLDIPMTLVTLIIPMLIIAIGNAYALHLVAEFMEESASGGDKKTIITRSFYTLLLPVLLTVSTTIIGFASLALNQIEMIREFALFSCFGLLSVFAIAMTLIPAMLSLLKMPKVRPHTEQSLLVRRLLNILTDFTVRHRKPIYVFMCVLLVVSIFGIFRINVETAVIEFFKKDDDIRLNFNDVSDTLAGAYPLNVVMISKKADYFKDPLVLHKLEELQEFLEGIDGIDKTISIADYIKTANMTYNRNFQLQVLPDDRVGIDEAVRKFFPAVFSDDLTDVRMTVTEDFSAANITCRTSFEGTNTFLEVEKQILEYCRENFSKDLEIQLSGIPLVIAHSAVAITRGQVKSLSLAFICVFVIMTLLFMSVKVGVVAMIPNMLPVLVNFAVMGIFGIPLSSATSLIASIALGIAVDDTIHFLAKYNTEFKKDWNKERSVRTTMLSVGRPIVFTSMTLGLGFSVLMLSSFQPTALFGLLMVITMLTALLGDLVLLPALMLNTELVTAWDFVALKLGDLPRKKMPLFEGFSKWQVKKLLVAGKLQKYARDFAVFQEGDLGDTMYAIISGGVDVVKGENEKVASFGVGEIFGEMGIVRKKERTATIRTNQPTELLHINDATLKRMQWRFPRIATRFYNNLTKILAERLDITTQKLIDKGHTK